MLFAYKKSFDQDQKVNRRNDRCLCGDTKDVPKVMRTKFPAIVMILEVVSNKTDVMPPHFFPQGLRVNCANDKAGVDVGCVTLNRECGQRKTVHLPTSLIRPDDPRKYESQFPRSRHPKIYDLLALQT